MALQGGEARDEDEVAAKGCSVDGEDLCAATSLGRSASPRVGAKGSQPGQCSTSRQRRKKFPQILDGCCVFILRDDVFCGCIDDCFGKLVLDSGVRPG